VTALVLTVVLMSQIGKKATGRLLDGRTWDEMPHQPTPEGTRP